jgi:hypothetical protein
MAAPGLGHERHHVVRAQRELDQLDQAKRAGGRQLCRFAPGIYQGGNSVRSRSGVRRHHCPESCEVSSHTAPSCARQPGPAAQAKPPRVEQHVCCPVEGRQPADLQRQGKTVTPPYVVKTSIYMPPLLGLGDTIRTGMGLFTDRAMLAMIEAMKDAL